MENLLNDVGTISGMATIFGRYRTAKKIPMVAISAAKSTSTGTVRLEASLP